MKPRTEKRNPDCCQTKLEYYTIVLCYIVLSVFLALAFALIKCWGKGETV